MSEIPTTTAQPSPWHDWYNAAVYQSFVDEFPIYPWLNRELARRARLRGVARILDVACGTGATAVGCLPEMDRDAELVGIDSARPMVEIARAEVRDPRCRFVVGDARRLGRYVEGRFDRAVCNAAFWQLTQPQLVLAELSRVMTRGGRFVFNVPSSYLDPERGHVHPFQVALARRLDAEHLHERGAQAPFHSIDALLEALEGGGFRADTVSEAHYQGRQGELVNLMRIPAMADSVADEVTEADCHLAIAQAVEEIDLDQQVTVSWTFVEATLLNAGRKPAAGVACRTCASPAARPRLLEPTCGPTPK